MEGKLQFSPDNVLSFALMILYGCQQSYAKFWTQREIDGFFFNQFLNPELQQELRRQRRMIFGQEASLLPCRWDEPNARSILMPPWGDQRDVLQEHFYRRGQNPETGKRIIADPVAESVLRKYGVRRDYFVAALLHDTPVTFQGVFSRPEYGPVTDPTFVGMNTEEPTPYFRIGIYGGPLNKMVRDFIMSQYQTVFLQKFLRDIQKEVSPAKFELWTQPGSTVRARFVELGLPCLEILSLPPFASATALLQTAKNAFHEYNSKLPGSKSVKPAIRVWAAYLLAEKCGLTNIEAIRIWNDQLGDEHRIPYTLDASSLGMRGERVTTSGESHFSGQKSDLIARIDHYREVLPTRMTRRVY
ncbi:MAG: hypothetical protein ACE5Q6_04760 [Dehalococcoidia bacterium]